MQLHRSVAIVTIAALAGVLLPARPVHAYCLSKAPNGTKWGSWPQQPIKYRVSSNLTDAAILDAIDKAFQTWHAAGCTNVSFQKGAAFPVSTPFDQGTGFVSIYWVTATSELPPKMDPSYFAYYYHGYDAAGTLTTASVAFNAFAFKWNTTGGAADTLDIQNAVTHFVGLLIGLGTSKTPATVMAPDVNFAQTYKRTLTADDVNGVSALYPSGTCPAPPSPDAACGVTPPPPPVDGGVKVDTGSGAKDGGGKPDTGKVSSDGKAGSDGKTTTGDGKLSTSETGSILPKADGGVTTGCTSANQCAAGEVCTIDHLCVKKADGGGCGCLVAGRPQQSALGLAGVLALACLGLLVWHRRRR